MGADEEESETAVRDRFEVELVDRGEGSGRVIRQRCVLSNGGGPVQVAQPVAGHGEKPSFRIVGDAVLRPVGESAFEGVGEGVLGGGNVARGRGEYREQAAVRLAGRPLGDRGYCGGDHWRSR